jgi:peptidoglycan/LPS O-acetylase OafA/YrhL
LLVTDLELRNGANDPVVARSHGVQRFRSDVEGMRGVAVFLVVACHCAIPGFVGGFVGVDVFFVLSGYLITGLLVEEAESTQKLRFLDFYARRVRRLLPACALVLLTTLLAAALFSAPQDISLTARATRAAALYMSNVFFDANAADYFAADVQTNPLLHTWSLGVEEQFYLIWPMLIAFTLVNAGSRRVFATTLCAVTIASLIVCVWSTTTNPTFAFYELPARAWEFSVGGASGTRLSANVIASNVRLVGVGLAGTSSHSWGRAFHFRRARFPRMDCAGTGRRDTCRVARWRRSTKL